MSIKLEQPRMTGDITLREMQSYLYRLSRQIEQALTDVSAARAALSDADAKSGKTMLHEEAQAAIDLLRTDVDSLFSRVQALEIKVKALENWSMGFERYIDTSFDYIYWRFDELEKTVNGG